LPFVAERRKAEANRIREKYPDRIPVSICSYSCILLLSHDHIVLIQGGFLMIQVIVEKAERSDIPDIDKKKSVASYLF
jgi:hypothetical protein